MKNPITFFEYHNVGTVIFINIKSVLQVEARHEEKFMRVYMVDGSFHKIHEVQRLKEWIQHQGIFER